MTIPHIIPLREALHNPAGVPRPQLVRLARMYHTLSAHADNPRSKYHTFYYTLAHECERRGYNLTRILITSPCGKGRNHE